jgi:hypothetical protein
MTAIVAQEPDRISLEELWEGIWVTDDVGDLIHRLHNNPRTMFSSIPQQVPDLAASLDRFADHLRELAYFASQGAL